MNETKASYCLFMPSLKIQQLEIAFPQCQIGRADDLFRDRTQHSRWHAEPDGPGTSRPVLD